MKYWDKILLVIGVLILAISLFLSFSSESVSKNELVRVTTSDYTFELKPYQTIDPPPPASWDSPQPQDDEGRWLYRVFTPPILYLVDGRLDPVPEAEIVVEEVVELPPFGVRFASIQREKYRLQLDAVYEMEIGDMSTARFIFENVYPALTDPPTYSVGIGDTHTQGNFRLDSVDRRAITDEGGGSVTEHIATITDLNDNKSVILSDNDTLFREGVSMIFESTLDSSLTAEIESPGDSFEMNDAVYTVLDISLDRGVATVVKEAEYLEMPEQEVLRLGQRPTQDRTPTPSGPLPSPRPSGDAGTDDLMNLFN